MISTEQSLQRIDKSTLYFQPVQPKQSPKMATIYVGKVPFKKPTSTTPFSKLPAELNTKIFDLAFGALSRDVANCRLASQDMFTLCSPYLIRTAVVAKRDDTRRKLQEVMRHPYFSKHVTHLLWDGSEFDRETAESDPWYDMAFLEDPCLTQYRVTPLHADVTERDERVTYVRYREGKPGYSEWNALLKSGRSINPRIHEDRVAELSPEEKLDIVDKGYNAQFYMVGRHQGKKQYAACLQTQDTLNSNWHLFRIALWVSKSLEHVSFSNFRALAYPEESYADLCRQLFGDMVRPRFFTAWGVQEFLCHLRVPHRGSWKSISIGHHPFLVNAFDKIEQGLAS